MGNVHCDSFYLILTTFMNMPSGRHPQPYRSLTSHQVQNISLPKGFTGNPSGCSMGHHHHAPKSSHQCRRRAYQSTQTVQPQTVHIFMWTCRDMHGAEDNHNRLRLPPYTSCQSPSKPCFLVTLNFHPPVTGHPHSFLT